MKIYFISFFLFLNACSYRTLVTNLASPIIHGGIDALFHETDAELARESLGAQLKLLEGFILNSPENEDYLTFAAMGFASYSIGFVEDLNPERAKHFYLRAKKYGLRALRIQSSYFKSAEKENFKNFKASLSHFNKDDVPALFWTAISWGLYINLSMDNVRALSELSKVEEMMKQVQKLDAAYFGGGADLFFGVIECVKPQVLGGNPGKGLQHFKTSLELSHHDFLLTKAFMVQYYTTATLNEELFDKWSEEILKAPPARNPQNNLPNTIAKIKIRNLLKQKEDLF